MNCRICNRETDAFLRIATDELDEPFLDATLRQRLPALELRRCAECGCLWANDARQDDRVLADAYERVAATYFGSLENDPRYAQFYKQVEEFVKRHVSGRTILDVGCGDGVFLSSMSSEWSKQGLEPSTTGASLARQRNLDVANATLDTASLRYEADVVSALDV